MARDRAQQAAARRDGRRAAGHSRRRNPERTKERLLDAAAAVFSEKGYGGARVADIAQRAGVNAQLISYYFGGKQGLFDAINDQWLRQETDFSGPDVPAAKMLAGYLDMICDQPEWGRLLLHRSLGGPFEEADIEDAMRQGWKDSIADLRRRQKAGELRADVDPAFILVLAMAATMAPIALEPVIDTLYGTPLTGAKRKRFLADLLRVLTPPDEPGS